MRLRQRHLAGNYLRCAKGVIKASVAGGALSPSCGASVTKCASKSTCGRVGAVTCCRTSARGTTKCAVKSAPSKCRAPSGGSACSGVFSSCCDACGSGGCAPPYTPTATATPPAATATATVTLTPSVTPTATIPPICHSDVPLPALAQVPFTIGQGSPDCGGVGLTNPPSQPPFSGAVTDGNGGTLGSLGAGCLYAGNVPGLRLPDGAQAKLDVVGLSLLPPAVTLAGSEGTGPFDCTKGAGPDRNCVNGAPGSDGNGACTSDSDCGALGACVLRANCYFGPPIPLALGVLGSCVVNAFLTDLCGQVSLLPPRASLATALEARVFLTGNLASPCPRCEGGLCNGGERQGEACTPVGTQGTTLECPPAASTYLSSLRVVIPELTTGTSTLSADDGLFCPGQTVPGALGIPGARTLSQTGVAPAGGSDLLEMTLAGTFCLPSANPLFDAVAQIPGAGAVAAKGTLDLSGVLP
jgi:hypothetical protein